MSWDMVRLGDICETTSGGTPLTSNRKYYGGTIPWLNSGEVNQGIINKVEKYITQEGLDNSSAKIVPKNSVLIAMYGATTGVVGLLCFPSAINQAICAIKPNKYILPSFLYMYLKTQRSVMLSKTAGGAQPNISQEIVKSLIIPLPPLNEQERIVKIIETKLNAVEKTKIIISDLNNTIDFIYNSYIRKIFNSNNNFNTVKLGELSQIERGGSPRPIEHFLTKDIDGINWIKIGDAKKDSKFIESTAEKIIKEGAKHSRNVNIGDLILSNSMSFGRPYILNIEGCIHDGWLVFSCFSSRINKLFLFYILSSSIVKNQFLSKASGAIVKNLNIDIVKNTEIPLPELEDQIKIVEILDKKSRNIEKIKNLLNEQFLYINALSSSILRKAFNGEF